MAVRVEQRSYVSGTCSSAASAASLLLCLLPGSRAALPLLRAAQPASRFHYRRGLPQNQVHYMLFSRRQQCMMKDRLSQNEEIFKFLIFILSTSIISCVISDSGQWFIFFDWILNSVSIYSVVEVYDALHCRISIHRPIYI